VSDLGFYALGLALVVAVAGLVAGLAGGFLRRADLTEVAIRAVVVVLALTVVAMLVLFHALATGDTQLQYVAAHSASTMPLGYRLAALWGGQAGSLLLWLFMLSLYATSAVLVTRRAHARLMPWVCASLLGNAAFYLVLLNFLSNPFERLAPNEVMSDGAGMNPLLQHPVMLSHPVMLYAGLTGFSVPFAFALAALATGQLGTAWLTSTRRWTLVAWTFLSIGILLGGLWAYEVLGWGGYWAWDPVENASFMPWLAATAYLHSVMIQEKRDMLRIWNLVLIGLTYSLCLFGTMITRSGLVQSVHAFAQTEIFGQLFLGYVAATAGLFFGLLFWRRHALRSSERLESALSREGSFLFNNWAFMVILAIVFWGTLFPKISTWLTGEEVLLGPGFFNRLALFPALFLLFLTGVGPLIAWRRASFASLRRQFRWPAIAGLATFAALLAFFRGGISAFPLATWSLCAFVLGTVVQEFARAIRVRTRGGRESVLTAFATLLRRYGGYVVHVGVVCILIGIGGAAFNEERLENLDPGDAIELGGYRLEYLTARSIPGRHYGGAVARIALWDEGEPVAVMAPEKRMYFVEQQPASIPSVYSTLREDLYVVLTALEPDGSATLKVYRNPLVNWIWIGGLAFVLGAGVILWPHPEPASRREHAIAAEPAAA
jgi:cytochrome c-type biogenesis protein CcmF